MPLAISLHEKPPLTRSFKTFQARFLSGLSRLSRSASLELGARVHGGVLCDAALEGEMCDVGDALSFKGFELCA